MDKNELRILIIEDDVTLAKGMVEAAKRAGFTALSASKPDEALSLIRMQVFHAFVIDCLLPKTSGVEVAKKLREQLGDKVPILLTSGIFKDKNFVKESVQKTKAAAFYEKPVAVETIIKKLEELLDDLIDEPMEPLMEILTKPTATPGEKAKAVAVTKTIHGFELPRVISYLMGPNTSGTLTLKEDQDTSSLSFSSGKIVKVMVKDPQSFFGALLVEKGYVMAEELELTLSAPSTKRVGERLVDANLISPHITDIIQSEQMAIRLGLLIKDTTYEISWTEESVPLTESCIDTTLIQSFFCDWAVSKLPNKWLKTFYMPFMENTIIRNPSFNTNHPIFSRPPLSHEKNLVQEISSGKSSLAALMSHSNVNEEALFNSLHVLVLLGLINFDKVVKTANQTDQKQRLTRILSDLENKNYFEILGVNNKTRTNDIKRAYHELAKVFHPDKLSQTTPPEVKSLTRDIFSKMTVAYETLSDDTRKAAYVKELEQGKAEKILQSESLFEDGKALLKSGQASKAIEKLTEAMTLRPPTSDLTLHFIWARMMTLSLSQNQKQTLLEIEQGLGKIPPEERHTAIYYFVKGLFQKYLGEIDLAKRNLEHALSLSPGFVHAQRELNVLKSAEKNKPVDIFRDDLSQVITTVFKKKK